MAFTGAIRAGRAFVELALRDRTSRGLQAAARRLRGFAAGVGAIGASLSAASASIAAPLGLAVRQFTTLGDEVGKAAKRTGFSVEALSALRYAAERSGASFEDLTGGLRNMSRFLIDAERGMSTATDSLADLGLTLRDLQGLTPEQRFLRLADALSKIEDPNRRAGIAMKIFGRSADKLLPLINEGLDGIQRLTQRARELGIPLSEEETKAAEKLTDLIADLTDLQKVTGVKIGAALAEPLGNAIEIMLKVVKIGNEWIKQNQGVVRAIAAVAIGLGAAGIVLTAFAGITWIASVAMTGLTTVTAIFGAVLGFIFSPLGALVLGIAALVIGLGALAYWFLTSTKLGRKLSEVVGKEMTSAFELLGAGLATALDLGTIGDFQKAFEIMAVTVAGIMAHLMKGIIDAWTETVAQLLRSVGEVSASLGLGDLGAGGAASAVRAAGAAAAAAVQANADASAAAIKVAAEEAAKRRKELLSEFGLDDRLKELLAGLGGVGGGGVGTFNPHAAAATFGPGRAEIRTVTLLELIEEHTREAAREAKKRKPGILVRP